MQINILIAMLSGRYEEIEKRSTQLFRFARHRTVIELESFLPMFLTGNVFPPFGLDDPEVHNDGPMSMAKYFPGGKGLDIDTEPFFNEAGYMATMSWEDWQSLQERRRAYLSSEIDDEAHQYVV